MTDPLLEIAQGVAALRYRLQCEENLSVNSGFLAGDPVRAACKLAEHEAVATKEAQRLGFTADELSRATDAEFKRLEAQAFQAFRERMARRRAE